MRGRLGVALAQQHEVAILLEAGGAGWISQIRDDMQFFVWTKLCRIIDSERRRWVPS